MPTKSTTPKSASSGEGTSASASKSRKSKAADMTETAEIVAAEAPAAEAAATEPAAEEMAAAEPMAETDAGMHDADDADGDDADGDDQGSEPAGEVITVKLKGLVDQIAEKVGVNKSDVRKVVEVTLEELGDALRRGESLSLPGLGRIRVLRKGTEDSPVTKLRMRPHENPKVKPPKKTDHSVESADTEALADESEDV